MTEGGLIKRIPTSTFKPQKKGGKGVKTKDDIISTVIRTNTVDSLMIFTDSGNMYRLLVDDIPVGNNTSKGISVRSLINIQPSENPTIIYSIYRDTKAKFILFVTKNGICKKSYLTEYINTSKKTGVIALKMREGDSLAGAALVDDEEIILTTKEGMGIRFKSSEVAPTSRATIGVKGISLKANDEVNNLVVIRDNTDDLALFTATGNGRRVKLSEIPSQARAGKGIILQKEDKLVAAAMVNDEDYILAIGITNSICVSAKEITKTGKLAQGSQIIKGTRLQGVSKV
jgi:DNA gyrase subunit A